MEMIPECFPYSEDRRNKQEPHDLQKYTVLYPSLHPTPTITKQNYQGMGTFGLLKTIKQPNM